MTLSNVQSLLLLNNREILDRIELLKDTIESLTGIDIENLKTGVSELQELIAEAQKQIDNIEDSSILNITKRLDEIDKNIKEITDDISNKYKDVDDRIVDVVKDISNLSTNLSTLSTSFDTHSNNAIIHVTQEDKDLWNKTLSDAKDYAKKLFDGVTSFNIEIVSVLPTENIKTMTVYFVPNSHSETQNYYDEYMYINSKWEHIGNTYVDLSAYVKTADLNKTLADYAKVSALSSYVKTTDLNTTLANYALKTELHSHANKSILDSLQVNQDYAKIKTLNEQHTITSRGVSYTCTNNGYLEADLAYSSGGGAVLYINDVTVADSFGTTGHTYYNTYVNTGDIIKTRGSYGYYNIKIYDVITLAKEEIITDEDINTAVANTIRLINE